MRVHHLNCATLRPRGGKRVNGDRFPLLAARMVCHCLLIESDRGLVLVDSGFGTADVERLRRWRRALRPRPRTGPSDSARRQLPRHLYAHFAIRARLDPEETAVRRVEALGHSPRDVTDIVLTHLDLDHAGGLADFPHARVHVHRAEHEFATGVDEGGERGMNRFRYWPYQWAHGPDWVTYDGGGDEWLGLPGAREVEGVPGVALVPLPGHSPGQCGVAVRVDGDKPWLLHAADSYFDHREIDTDSPSSTPGVAAFQKQLEFDATARRDSRHRVRALVGEHGDEVDVFCSHDPVEFERLA